MTPDRDRLEAVPDRAVTKAREICEAYGLNTRTYSISGIEHPMVRHLTRYIEAYEDELRTARTRLAALDQPGVSEEVPNTGTYAEIKAHLGDVIPCYGAQSGCRMDDATDCNEGCAILGVYRRGYKAAQMAVDYVETFDLLSEGLRLKVFPAPNEAPSSWRRRVMVAGLRALAPAPVVQGDPWREKPTIAELEAMLNDPRPSEVHMLPDGQVRARFMEPIAQGVDEETLARAGDALRAACRKRFGSDWSLDAAREFARAVIAALQPPAGDA